MAKRDRLSALNLIGRIRSHELESIGAELSALRAQQAEVDTAEQTLTERAQFETQTSTEDTRPFLPQYLQSVGIERAALHDRQDALNTEAAGLEARMLEAFKASKTNDAVLERVQKDLKEAAARKDISELDEAGRNLFLRRKSSGPGGSGFQGS